MSKELKTRVEKLCEPFDDPDTWDSLDVVEMVMMIEEEFGVEIPDEEAEEMKNPADFVAWLEKRRANRG